MKIVIGRSPEGFILSPLALKRLIEMDSPIIRKEEADELDLRLVQDSENIGDGYQTNWINSLVKDGFVYGVRYYSVDRSHPDLIKVVEELGQASWGERVAIKVVEIPDDVEWEVREEMIDCGAEEIVEKHRTWT